MNATTYTPANAIRHAALHAAINKGWVEISSGVFLYSQENIIADQANWGDEDGGKRFDFTTGPYWLSTDNCVEPIPVYGENDNDLIKALQNA